MIMSQNDHYIPQFILRNFTDGNNQNLNYILKQN